LKRPVRFSLLSLVLLTTIVALAIAVVMMHSRLREAEAELERLKDQFGELSINDRSQVQAISVPTAEAWNWRWRIYLPGGHDFGLYTIRGKLDAKGLPPAASHPNASRIGGQSDPNQPREIIIDVVLGETAEGYRCLWISENGKAGGPIVFGKSPPTWAGGKVMFAERIAGERKTVAAAATSPLVLISLDGVDATGASCDDAVLIWIGPYEQTPLRSLRERAIH
jgi:hypothetical protein